MIRAVLFDFGGVILTSPFEAFAAYERRRGLPTDFIRGLNAANPDDNAWARLERSEVDIDGFAQLFEAEALAAGHTLDAREVLDLLRGEVRPEMVEAVRRIKERGLALAVLTNNFVSGPASDPRTERPEVAEVLGLFDQVVESSKVGVRKPDQRFYRMACDALGIEPPEAVFLDDLGINLKPARRLGITTIKVVTPEQALTDLEEVLGFPLR